MPGSDTANRHGGRFFAQGHRFRFDDQVPSRGHRVAGVDTEIEQHLLNLSRVGKYGFRLVTEQELQIDVFANDGADHLAEVLNDGVDINMALPKYLPAPKTEEVPCKLGRATRGDQNLLQVLIPLLLRHEPFDRIVGVARNCL